jgi:hypothetical protein
VALEVYLAVMDAERGADLDSVTRSLADIQDQLIALPRDAFAERYALEKQQDTLRVAAARFRSDWDTQQPTADLTAELAALRSRIGAIEAERIDMVSQSGGGSLAGPGADGWGAVGINQQIEKAHGAQPIRDRIARIVGILADRGIEA